MKIKFLPIIAAAAGLFLTVNANAQRSIDWTVESINVPPSIIRSKADLTGSDIVLNATLKNNGGDNAKPGDSVFYRFQIPLSQTQAILLPGQTVNNYFVRILDRELAPGDTIVVNTAVTIGLYLQNASTNISVTAVSLLRNGAGSDILADEAQSTLANNVLSQQIEWLVPQGWGVNVATVDANQSVSVFPNPSNNGIFTVQTQFSNSDAALNVMTVYDLGGRVVYTQQAGSFSGATQLDLSFLQNGLYLLEYSNGFSTATAKISIVK
jgi:hypothetical protein